MRMHAQLINYGHLADLHKTLPTTDVNTKKTLSFDEISPHDFYFFPFFLICTCLSIDWVWRRFRLQKAMHDNPHQTDMSLERETLD